MKINIYAKRWTLCLLLLTLAGCAAPGPDPALVRDAGASLGGFPVKRLSENNDCYSLQIDYPDLGNPAIDRQIRAWVAEKYASSTGEFNELCRRVPPRQPFRFWVEYDLQAAAHTVSVVFKSLIYAGGGQYHDWVDVLNCRWADGRVLGYTDIFVAPDGLPGALAAQVRKALAPTLGEVWKENPEFSAAVDPVQATFSNFAITENGLLLYFPTRQIAPFYAGPQQCEVPLGELLKFGPKAEIW